MRIAENITKGRSAAMVVHCLALGGGKSGSAMAYAEGRYRAYPEVAFAIKATVAAGGLSAANFAEEIGTGSLGVELIEAARGLSVLDRLDAVRVPFRRAFTHDEAVPRVSWRTEGSPKAVGAVRFSPQTRFEPHIASSIIVISMELAEASDAVQQIRRLLIRALAIGPDVPALDPGNAGTDGAPPALTDGAPVMTPTGTSASAIAADVTSLLAAIALNGNLSSPVLVASPLTCVKLAGARDSAGSPAFPGVRVDGGVLLGVPLLASPATLSEGSPTVDHIIAIDAAAIAIAASSDVLVSVSTEASVQIDSAPSSSPAQQTSLWQHNLCALRIERQMNWRSLRANAAASLQVVF